MFYTSVQSLFRFNNHNADNVLTDESTLNNIYNVIGSISREMDEYVGYPLYAQENSITSQSKFSSTTIPLRVPFLEITAVSINSNVLETDSYYQKKSNQRTVEIKLLQSFLSKGDTYIVSGTSGVIRLEANANEGSRLSPVADTNTEIEQICNKLVALAYDFSSDTVSSKRLGSSTINFTPRSIKRPRDSALAQLKAYRVL